MKKGFFKKNELEMKKKMKSLIDFVKHAGFAGHSNMKATVDHGKTMSGKKRR